MKFLDVPTLVELNEWLSCIECSDCTINGRLEAYSCKRSGSDRKLYRAAAVAARQDPDGVRSPPVGGLMSAAGSAPVVLVTPIGSAIAVPGCAAAGTDALAMGTSPYGPLSLQTSRTTLTHLVAALNAIFPDYDFTDARPESFSKVHVSEVLADVDGRLSPTIPDYSEVRSKMWTAMDKEIQMQQCEIYSFIPSPDDDPFAEDDSLWAVNYFFFNKSLRRILFFTVRCQQRGGQIASEELQFGVDDDAMDV
eukprot:m51a1_g14617 hypothetical protein (251) ;mRNA; r:1216902-1218296